MSCRVIINYLQLLLCLSTHSLPEITTTHTHTQMSHIIIEWGKVVRQSTLKTTRERMKKKALNSC